MAPRAPDPLAVILAELRARLAARVRAASDATARLQALAARYHAAVQAEADAELARRRGQRVRAPIASPRALALELAALIASLPELGEDDGEAAAEPAREGPAPSFSELLAASKEAAVAPARAPRSPRAHPEVLALADEVRGVDLDALSASELRARALGWAARARQLRERAVADPEERLAGVLRALTRAARQRRLAIIGLDPRDRADWQAQLERSRRLIARREEREPASKRTPKRERGARDEPVPAAREPWPVPSLARAALGGAVVIAGGVLRADKLERVIEHLGFEPEWVSTEAPGLNATAALERRIRAGHVAAVVLLEGLVSHAHSELLVSAARQASVPLAHGGTAGVASLRRAFVQLDAQLARET
ncbi:MAG: hypothetical protein OZ921_05740 [Sorangiineae bacterium]|nr:hypothetical protein [Polyangiaceae bacterium]MEB2321996.1 hypothetical protein [Sorangiineae bacterium]